MKTLDDYEKEYVQETREDPIADCLCIKETTYSIGFIQWLVKRLETIEDNKNYKD